MSRRLTIRQKIAICDKAIKERFGSKSGIKRAAAGHWEVIIFRGLCDYEIKATHPTSPFLACKQAGVSVEEKACR